MKKKPRDKPITTALTIISAHAPARKSSNTIQNNIWNPLLRSSRKYERPDSLRPFVSYLQITQPPIFAPCLQVREPPAGKIQRHYDGNPKKIDVGQTVAVALGDAVELERPMPQPSHGLSEHVGGSNRQQMRPVDMQDV